jgi:dephospho-CoA kinase
MFVVGLTGGIGSGKTAVSDRFAALGIEVVDADIASRAVVEPGSEALDKIAEHFGPEILQDDGTLDRAALRTRIFQNKEDKAWLESLLHPLIGMEIYSQLEKAKSPYVIFASPLMVETGQIILADRLLVVDVPEEVQLARTIERDSNAAEQVKAIMASQATREQRLEKADDVILNTRGLDFLDQEVARLHKNYLQLAMQKAEETTP